MALNDSVTSNGSAGAYSKADGTCDGGGDLFCKENTEVKRKLGEEHRLRSNSEKYEPKTGEAQGSH